MREATQAPIYHGLVESWQEDWSPGAPPFGTMADRVEWPEHTKKEYLTMAEAIQIEWNALREVMRVMIGAEVLGPSP